MPLVQGGHWVFCSTYVSMPKMAIFCTHWKYLRTLDYLKEKQSFNFHSLFIYQDENEDENQSFCCSCMFWNKHVTNDPIIMKSNTQGLICLSQAWSRTNQNFRKNQNFCFHLCLGTWTGYLSSTVLPAMRNLCDSKVNVNVELPEKLEVGETHS